MTKIKIMNELKNIAIFIKSVYEKNAWHGPSVKESINGITQEQALKKLNNTHTIIELLGHMTAWRRYVINKLTGDINFQMTDSLNFPSETNWEYAIKKLEESQSDILASIGKFPEEKLLEPVPFATRPYNYYTLLHGIVHHDIYHAGQIMIIRKHFNF
jgi:uncharacterized damage-inducible protein DinB